MSRLLQALLLILAAILGILLVMPLVVPIPPLRDTVPPQQLADPDSLFAEVRGVLLHYNLAGHGEPGYLLLHGFASSVFSWREVLHPLGAQSQAVAYDRPGFGLTERPMPGEWTDENPYSPSFQAGLAVGLMDPLGMDRAILVGNSAGGAIAIHAALEYPERVTALILISPAVSSGSSGGRSRWLPQWLEPLASTPQHRRIGPLLVRNIQTWAGISPRDPGTTPPRSPTTFGQATDCLSRPRTGTALSGSFCSPVSRSTSPGDSAN